MAEFIVNPRRAPRAPARCKAAVSSTQGLFEAETEDIGAMGCQLVSPKLVRKGELVQLHVTNDKVAEPLKASGHVAWVSPQAPWRLGIAFDEGSHRQSSRWFDQLVASYPGLGGYRRVPDRIRADATVFLGPPPKFLLDFNGDEAMLLRAIGSGAQIDELMARLRDQWPPAQRALFSLIARQAVTFQRGQAVHPDTWKKILSDVEASLAVEALGKGDAKVLAPPAPAARPTATPVPAWPSATPVPVWPTATPIPARPTATAVPARPAATPVPELARPPGARSAYASPWPATPPLDPSRVVDLPIDDSAPLEVATSTPAPGWSGAGQGDFQGAGVGWRRTRGRPAEAQAVFDRALAELQAGSVAGAIALLRRALQLAPGDPEIAAQLGKLAFKDRMPGPT